MQRKKIRQLFQAYLDGELTFEEEEGLERVLDGDTELRSELRGLQRTREILAGLSQTDPGEEFTRDVLRRVRTVRESELSSVGQPLGERLANWFAVWLAPKPAFGAAMALVLGLAVGLGAHEIAAGRDGSAPPPVAAVQTSPVEMDDAPLQGPDPTDMEPIYAWPSLQQVVGTEQGQSGEQRVEFLVQPYFVQDRDVAEPLFLRPSNESNGTAQGASVTY